MLGNSANSKRIAKNTLLLYFRMFITMAVGLYTSRVVLNVLGISDYGIYNVVGGIITMGSFLNAAMAQASQRYLSFEMGRGDANRLNRVFCTSLNIHLVICFVAVVVGETIGLWFINTQLNIPENRMIAANWVYQASVLTFVIGVMSVPYNSTIVAHERLSAFAYISVLEVVMKLAIVYMLLIIQFDKLIVYSILMVLVSIGIRLCYTVYCQKHFQECSYHFVYDKKLTCEMFSFAGWSVFGNVGFSFKDQISNIILNIFFGTAVNAARGIGIHVTTLINTFATNFTMALNPQITKQYATGQLEESRKLVYAGCRYSFYLLSLASIPLIINIDYVLRLWLVVVPEYTSQFVVLALLTSLLYTFSGSVTTAIQATGRVKWFQIGICLIMLSELPIAWLLLKKGFPPYSVMWPTIVTYMIALFFRFWLLKRYVLGYDYWDYMVGVVLRSILIFCICIFLCYIVCSSLNDNFLNFILSSLVCVILTSTIVFFLGVNASERKALRDKLIKLYAYAKHQ